MVVIDYRHYDAAKVKPYGREVAFDLKAKHPLAAPKLFRDSAANPAASNLRPKRRTK